MTSIIFLTGAIQRNQFNIFLKDQNFLSEFFSAFLKSTLKFEHFETKDNPRSVCISNITDCE